MLSGEFINGVGICVNTEMVFSVDTVLKMISCKGSLTKVDWKN